MKELPGIPTCEHKPEFMIPGSQARICRDCAVRLTKKLAKELGLVITENDMDFMTPPEIAKILKVSRQTVYNMLEAGNLPAVRHGKYFYVPRSEVLKLIQEKEKNHHAP